MSNYATKFDSKNETVVSTSDITKKADLPSLKSFVDELDIDILKDVQSGLNSLKSKADQFDVDKLKLVPVSLKKLGDALENDTVKKTAYDQLVGKLNAIDISGLVNKTDYNAKIKDIEDKISSII